MIQINPGEMAYRPDTCMCEVLYNEYSNSKPDKVIFNRCVKCDFHNSATTGAQLHSLVKLHNRVWNDWSDQTGQDAGNNNQVTSDVTRRHEKNNSITPGKQACANNTDCTDLMNSNNVTNDSALPPRLRRP